MRGLQNSLKRNETRSGQVLVLAVAAILVMLLLSALAIDVGYIKCARARMQNAADAAAVAAALELAAQRNNGAAESAARAAAAAEALDIAALNWDPCRCEVLFGTFYDHDGDGEMEFVEAVPDIPATAVKATMVRDEAAPGGLLALFFAPAMGLDAVQVQTSAASQIAYGIRTIRTGLRPFAVWEGYVVPPGQQMKIYWPDLIVPGCFGLLNLDGGSLGTPELKNWILNGYDGEIDIDPVGGVLITGTTGWRATLKSAVEERIGDVILICVYDNVWGTGSNGTFHIIRFLPIRLDYCRLAGNDPYIKGTVQSEVTVPDGETGGDGDNLGKVQLVM